MNRLGKSTTHAKLANTDSVKLLDSATRRALFALSKEKNNR